jgi:hypothetical protein
MCRKLQQYWRSRVLIAVQIDVVPSQRPGLPGPNPGGQGQDHVGAETRVILGAFKIAFGL